MESKYAIINLGGKQFFIRVGERISVPLRKEEPGQIFESNDAVLVKEDGESTINPTNFCAKFKILSHGAKKKIIVYHKKRRSHHREKTQGHREKYTELLVESISFSK